MLRVFFFKIIAKLLICRHVLWLVWLWLIVRRPSIEEVRCQMSVRRRSSLKTRPDHMDNNCMVLVNTNGSLSGVRSRVGLAALEFRCCTGTALLSACRLAVSLATPATLSSPSPAFYNNSKGLCRTRFMSHQYIYIAIVWFIALPCNHTYGKHFWSETDKKSHFLEFPRSFSIYGGICFQVWVTKYCWLRSLNRL